jgi:uncharacterized protein YndB with AHSA1/START domain
MPCRFIQDAISIPEYHLVIQRHRNGNTIMTSETYNVVVTRIFDAPVERVWRAWSEPQLVMQWWGPTGFTCPKADMDFREGGTSLVCMRAPQEYGGGDFFNTWAYNKIVPYQSIEFATRFTDQNGTPLEPSAVGIPPGVPSSVQHVITFRPIGEGQTEMTVTEYGYTLEEARNLSKMGMEQCIDKMAAALATATEKAE